MQSNIRNSAMQSNNPFNRCLTSQDSFSANIDNANTLNSFQDPESLSKSSVTGSLTSNSFILDSKPITAQLPPKNLYFTKIPQTNKPVSPNIVSQVNNNIINSQEEYNKNNNENNNNIVPLPFRISLRTSSLAPNNNQECPELKTVLPNNNIFINSRDEVDTINNIVPLQFKTTPQTSSLPKNNNQECPERKTVPLNNNIMIGSNNFNLPSQNNNDINNPEIILSREDQLERLKSSINTYNNLKRQPLLGQNNNQGCPQLFSVPFNKATLTNKEINIKDNDNNVVESTQGQNSNVVIPNSNIQQFPQTAISQNLNIALSKLNYIKALSQNPNNQGCPQLVSIQPPTNTIASQNNLGNVQHPIKNENGENSNMQISNNILGCPQVIPTTYIDNSSPQKVGNIATFTLNNNKMNTINSQPAVPWKIHKLNPTTMLITTLFSKFQELRSITMFLHKITILLVNR